MTQHWVLQVKEICNSKHVLDTQLHNLYIFSMYIQGTYSFKIHIHKVDVRVSLVSCFWVFFSFACCLLVSALPKTQKEFPNLISSTDLCFPRFRSLLCNGTALVHNTFRISWGEISRRVYCRKYIGRGIQVRKLGGKIKLKRGPSDSTVSGAFILHEADLGSIPRSHRVPWAFQE